MRAAREDRRMSTRPEAETPRIGYLLRMYPRFSQTFVVNEILELERQGANLRIGSLRRPTDGAFHDSISRVRATCDYLPDYFFENWSKIRTAHLDRARAAFRGWSGGLASALTFRDVSFFDFVQAALVCRWAAKHKLRHLHVHFGTSEATVAWLARRMGGPSYSLTLHAFDIFRENVDRDLLARKINAAEFVVTVCQSNQRFMAAHLPGVDVSRIRVNYNGIDLERFAAASGPREPLSIFAVGRLIEKKGFDHLVRAVARLRDRDPQGPLGRIRCAIAGDGPEESRLKSLIGELRLKDQVRLLGPLRQEEIRTRLGTAACFVLPCVRARDGNIDALPTVLLEAQARGCPVISTNLSGNPEIIEDGRSGLLVEPEADDALAEAIARVLLNDTLAAELGAGGRARAEERFDARKNVAVMRSWLLAAAGAPSADRETFHTSNNSSPAEARP
jgi:colanic acid/amylovoran biosynthesis glycosyltransferase